MTIDELKMLIENSYDDVESKDSIYEGLTILKKYHPHSGMDYSFAHDQMWVNAYYVDEYLKSMPDEDVKRMVGLGWLVSEDYWSHF